MFIFLALAVTLVVVIYFWQKGAYSFWTDRGIPQLQPRFPIGTFRTDINFVYHFDEAYKKFKNQTKYLGIYTSVQPTLMVFDLELIKRIMIKDFQFFQSRGLYYNEESDPLSAHLFTLEEGKWHKLRNKLSPTFTSGKMKLMCPIVVEIGKKFIDTMNVLVEDGGSGIDMREMFARFTTDVIGTCAFGLECNSLKDPNAPFRLMGMKVLREPRHSIYLQFIINVFPKIAKIFKLKVLQDDVSEFFLRVVNDTFEHRIKNNIKRNDFVDLLIALRNENKSNSMKDSKLDGLSMNEIAAQCFVFFLAGFETSSTVSSFTIYELARNQQIQDKLREHIRKVLAKHEGKITYEALKDMTYLEQCINEGMRMYPAVPLLSRITTSPFKIPDTDVVLPKDLPIAIPVYSIQQDPEIYPNPNVFDPDRFSPEKNLKRPTAAFLPFGDGPRNCIGERFGMMQAKIGMAYLISNYKFILNAKTEPIKFKKESFILTPETSLYFDVARAQ